VHAFGCSFVSEMWSLHCVTRGRTTGSHDGISHVCVMSLWDHHDERQEATNLDGGVCLRSNPLRSDQLHVSGSTQQTVPHHETLPSEVEFSCGWREYQRMDEIHNI
jgi:hypothetical protein